MLVELQTVDHPAEPYTPEIGFELELQTDGPDGARILDLEVLANQRFRVGLKGDALIVGEAEFGELGVIGEIAPPRSRSTSAASITRSSGGRSSSNSSAWCTSVPRLAATDGGSGSRSM